MNTAAIRQQLTLLALILLLCSSTGCQWLQSLMRGGSQSRPDLPRVLSANPSLEEVTAAVNRNNGSIQSFTTNEAELDSNQFPIALRDTSINFERPQRLRIQAGTTFTSTEVDLGSNDQYFWFWVKRLNPPQFFYGRHDQLACCRGRNMMPIETDWLVESLGLVQFDRNETHQGPYPQPGGELAIQTTRTSPSGNTITRIVVVDPYTAVVNAQYIYDQNNNLLFSSKASDHRRDPMSGLIMPTMVVLESPQNNFKLDVALGNVQINVQRPAYDTVFAMPQKPGYQLVDVCNPGFMPTTMNPLEMNPQPTMLATPERPHYPDNRRIASPPINRLQR